LRIYDDRSGVPQPAGPVELDVHDNATDDEIIAAIRREWANQSRPFSIDWNGGRINQGWRLVYRDKEERAA
jgi:hypothetical protein